MKNRFETNSSIKDFEALDACVRRLEQKDFIGAIYWHNLIYADRFWEYLTCDKSMKGTHAERLNATLEEGLNLNNMYLWKDNHQNN